MTKEEIFDAIKDEDEVDIWVDDGDKMMSGAPSMEMAEFMLDNIEAGCRVEARVYYDDDGNKIPVDMYDGECDVDTIFDSDDYIAADTTSETKYESDFSKEKIESIYYELRDKYEYFVTVPRKDYFEVERTDRNDVRASIDFSGSSATITVFYQEHEVWSKSEDDLDAVPSLVDEMLKKEYDYIADQY